MFNLIIVTWCVFVKDAAFSPMQWAMSSNLSDPKNGSGFPFTWHTSRGKPNAWEESVEKIRFTKWTHSESQLFDHVEGSESQLDEKLAVWEKLWLLQLSSLSSVLYLVSLTLQQFYWNTTDPIIKCILCGAFELVFDLLWNGHLQHIFNLAVRQPCFWRCLQNNKTKCLDQLQQCLLISSNTEKWYKVVPQTKM